MQPTPRPPDVTTAPQEAPHPPQVVDPTPPPPPAPPPDPNSPAKLGTVVDGGPNGAAQKIPQDVQQMIQSIETDKIGATRFWHNFKTSEGNTTFEDAFETKRKTILENWDKVLDFAKTHDLPVAINGEKVIGPSEAVYADYLKSDHEVIRTQASLGYLNPEEYGKKLGPYGVAGVDGKEGGFTYSVEVNFYNDYKSGKFKELEGKEPDPNFTMGDVSAKAGELAAKKQAKTQVNVVPSQDGKSFDIKQGDVVYAKLVKEGNSDFILTVVKAGLEMKVESQEGDKHVTAKAGETVGGVTAVKTGDVIHIGPAVDIEIKKFDEKTVTPIVITRTGTVEEAKDPKVS